MLINERKAIIVLQTKYITPIYKIMYIEKGGYLGSKGEPA